MYYITKKNTIDLIFKIISLGFVLHLIENKENFNVVKKYFNNTTN